MDGRSLLRRLCAFALVSASSVANAQYDVLAIPSPYGVYDEARTINSTGQVGGVSFLSGFTSHHATFYSGGATQDVGTLGGAWSITQGINDSGYLVGWSSTSGEAAQRAFLYDGTMHDLGTLGGTNSYAYAINNSGQIVGSTFDASNLVDRGFLYSGGVMQDIGTLGSSTVATDINNDGQITGYSNTVPFGSGGVFHAFRYANGVMEDLGTLGGTNSFASAINASGQVVGSSEVSGDASQHAFLDTGGVMIDLGTLGGDWSVAFDINSSGDIVGFSFDAANNGHAFLYRNGVMFDLNSLIDPNSGWIIDFAYGINDAGQIVGRGFDGNRFWAVLLSPVTIPEPGTHALLIVGLALVGFKARGSATVGPTLAALGLCLARLAMARRRKGKFEFG